MFFASFLYLQFGFVIFWQKNIIAKKAHKIFNYFVTRWRASTPVQLMTTSKSNSSQISDKLLTLRPLTILPPLRSLFYQHILTAARQPCRVSVTPPLHLLLQFFPFTYFPHTFITFCTRFKLLEWEELLRSKFIRSTRKSRLRSTHFYYVIYVDMKKVGN